MDAKIKEALPWVAAAGGGILIIYFLFGQAGGSGGSSGSSGSTSAPGSSTADYVALANAATQAQAVANQGAALSYAAQTQQMQQQTALTAMTVGAITNLGGYTLNQAANIENSYLGGMVAQTNALASTAGASIAPESSSISSANNISVNATTQAANAWASFTNNGGLKLL